MRVLDIVVVDSDKSTQLLVPTILSEHRIRVIDSGEEILTLIEQQPEIDIDVLIIDAKLPGINGFDTCKQLRKIPKTADTPILFLSSFSGLSDRLYAYGIGANDYFSKPFDVVNFRARIDHCSKTINQREEYKQQLRSSHELIRTVQIGSAKLQSISRFVQAAQFVHDTDTLQRFFLKTAAEIGLDGVLYFQLPGKEVVFATDGVVSKFEREILEMRAKLGRIESFGRNRAVFNWGNAVLLCRGVDGMIDILAILMDAVTTALKSIVSDQNLLQQMERLHGLNKDVEEQIIGLCENLNQQITEAVLRLGLVSSIDLDDANEINDLFGNFHDAVFTALQSLSANNQQMADLLEEQKRPPQELRGLLESLDSTGIKDDEEDGMELF